MQTVSDSWKEAHKQTILNESFVEVSMDIADPDALAAAQSGDNGAVYFSNTWNVVSEVDKNIAPYCTLEQNLWLLNGGRKAIPVDAYREDGYIGDVLSDDTCVFSSKIPSITIDFGKVFESFIPGITITWSVAYNEFADSFIVTAYKGDTIVAEKEVIGNRSVKSLVMMNIVNYNRIVIKIKKWCLPYHRPRIDEIFVGMNKVYSKTELFSYSHSQSVDPISTSLPKAEIKFSIDNVNGEYNPYNEEGMAKYLMERQEVKARYGLKQDDGTIEWIKGGTFYLSEWSAKQNGLTADFAARDMLEFMSKTFDDHYDVTSTPRTLWELADEVLWAEDLPMNSDGTVKWIIDESLKSITTNARLPKDTLANCLQLIANAAMCVLYQDREGILHIEPLKFDDTDYTINSFNSYSKPEITLSKSIKQVKVNVYSYRMSDKGVSSDTTEVIVPIGSMGETITIDNPLITNNDMAIALGTWVGTHLGHRMTIESSWRPDVRLDPLDIITVENAYDSKRVRVTEVEYDFNGAFRGTSEGKVI